MDAHPDYMFLYFLTRKDARITLFNYTDPQLQTEREYWEWVDQ